MSVLMSTDLSFPVAFEKYNGKVRDTYKIMNSLLVLVASDRISAFDVILPRGIPYKGQVLNQTAAYFLEATTDICPNHVVAVPDPNVTIGRSCKQIPVEMVIRGYLAGHAWRIYRDGGREICGVTMPDGLVEGQKLPEPILTPATKSTIGHDEDISEADILKSGLVDEEDWAKMKHYAFELYKRGTEMAAKQGLILVDTKYEFGIWEDDVILIDEIHTPDSSRYYYLEGYEERLKSGEPQKQLSKEFIREWLMENGFQGQEGQQIPEMTDEVINEVTERYIEVYETLTGKTFDRTDNTEINKRIQSKTTEALLQLGMEETSLN